MRKLPQGLQDLQDIDLAELNLDPATYELVQMLLNCIETLVGDLNEAQAEIQRLRDEIARLKGERGKPKIKANRSPGQDDDDPSRSNPDRANGDEPQSNRKPKSDTDSGQSVPRKERIEVDREEVVKLDRSQLPPDVEHRGYRDVIIQNIVFETDTVRYRLERLYSESEGEFYEASLPEAWKRQRYGSELQAFVIMLYFELRVTEGKILDLLQSAGIVISAGQISNILIEKHLQMFAEERKAILQAGLQTTSYHHIVATIRRYNWLELANGVNIKLTSDQISGAEPIPRGRRWQDTSLFSQGESTGETAESFIFNNEAFYPKRGRHWSTKQAGLERLVKAGRINKIGTLLRFRRFADDFPIVPLNDIWRGTMIGKETLYVVQTATRVIERCILMTTDPGDLVFDPTCGSGTTAYAAEQWGRRWITVDTSRVALALARTRLMTARYPYYLLADSPEGLRQAAEMRGQIPPTPLPKTNGDVKQGFVYRQVPHVMLRDIARNEEIDDIHEKWQAQIEPVLQDLTGFENLSGLQEWELPRQPDDDWPQPAKDLLHRWWELRRARQKEIDDSIARHSESETLYDQPYEDRRKLRVSGPFTVESLSPHRVLSTDEERPASEAAGQQAQAGGFEMMIIENLRKAGVQNTIKNERLNFDRLEPYAGEWLQAEGEYTETLPSPSQGEGPGVRARRVAVAIGPEHGTVGPQLIKEAAKEAVRGIGFDLLIVCGFAFDPHVAEETRRYGKLTVLTARMNPDLAMGDTLLKKTGSGNLFMVFGEPDVEIRRDDGQVVIEIKGLDIYDPTTGEIRASSTSDIACWFIDTNYNEESFFVRQAYFTGADKPYEKLKRALRAEVDEAAWSALYSTVSRPFDPPATGKVAVKVINHYGDEVLQVYEI